MVGTQGWSARRRKTSSHCRPRSHQLTKIVHATPSRLCEHAFQAEAMYKKPYEVMQQFATFMALPPFTIGKWHPRTTTTTVPSITACRFSRRRNEQVHQSRYQQSPQFGARARKVGANIRIFYHYMFRTRLEYSSMQPHLSHSPTPVFVVCVCVCVCVCGICRLFFCFVFKFLFLFIFLFCFFQV